MKNVGDEVKCWKKKEKKRRCPNEEKIRNRFESVRKMLPSSEMVSESQSLNPPTHWFTSLETKSYSLHSLIIISLISHSGLISGIVDPEQLQQHTTFVRQDGLSELHLPNWPPVPPHPPPPPLPPRLRHPSRPHPPSLAGPPPLPGGPRLQQWPGLRLHPRPRHQRRHDPRRQLPPRHHGGGPLHAPAFNLPGKSLLPLPLRQRRRSRTLLQHQVHLPLSKHEDLPLR